MRASIAQVNFDSCHCLVGLSKQTLYGKMGMLGYRLCLGAWIKSKIGLILRLIIYLIFGKLYFGLDYGTKFKFSLKIMGLAIPIET